MLVRAHFAGPEGRPERHRLHRAQQRRKVVAHQHAHRPHRAGQGVGDARKDTSHQPLPHQRCLVSGRPARLRLRPHVENTAQRVFETDHRLRHQVREDALPVRAGGHPPRTPEDRPAVHRDAGRKRHPLRHHLHQGRQALEKSVERFRTALAQQWEELPPMFVSSSEKAVGREEILDFIGECLRQN